jgi:hypothetical protein
MPTEMIPLTVKLSRADLVDELVASFCRSGCAARRIGSFTCRVVHTAARDEDEARTEVTFFLRAWQGRHPEIEASLVSVS